MKREYAKGPLEWLVSQHHVMAPNFTIARDIVKRTKSGWPRAQRVMAIRDAIEAHHENRRLYLDVMGGHI